MKRLLSMAVCLGMLTAASASASAQERETQRRDQDQARTQAQQGQQQGQQTIRGTVAGVTTVGEAVIDPKTGRAVAVQQNYLTVLGSPAMGGQRGQGQRGQGGQESPTTPNAQRTPGQQGQDQQANQGRQNLYLIAITPQTTVREGGQQAGPGQARSPQDRTQNQAQDRTQNQSVFEKLEIGDRVMVQFKSTDRLQAKAEGSEAEDQKTAQDKDKPQEQVTGFRGDPKSKHGRTRIYIGEASTITIMSAEAGQQRGGQRGQRGQERDRQDDDSTN
jgi:hypothetical protein